MPTRISSLHFAALLLMTPVTLAAAQRGASTSAAERGVVRVVIETGKGNIAVDLDSAHAPISVANFLRYVDGGFYDGGRFHRTVTPGNQPNSPIRIEVVQAGANPERSGSSFPPIALERTSATGLHHVDGTLSMARAGPNSATSDFFICIGDQPALDFGGLRNPDGQGFAAFGRVTAGMAVVRAIQASPAAGQQLKPPISLVRIRRVAR
jgi:peptidyl-prolyl cis-trans isomerase A (cyclophilin A)